MTTAARAHPAAANYKVAVVNGAASPTTGTSATIDYWSTGGRQRRNLERPSLGAESRNATSPGQSTYNLGPAFTYPDTYDTGGAPTYWVDVEVTPSSRRRA